MKSSIALALVIAATAALVAVGNWPYGVYTLVRWIVCGSCAFAAYSLYHQGRRASMIAAIVVAVVFNPIAPLYFKKVVWQKIDILAGALCIGLALFVEVKARRQKNGQSAAASQDRLSLDR